MTYQELNGKSDINFSDKFLLDSRIQKPSTLISLKVHYITKYIKYVWCQIGLKYPLKLLRGLLEMLLQSYSHTTMKCIFIFSTWVRSKRYTSSCCKV